MKYRRNKISYYPK